MNSIRTESDWIALLASPLPFAEAGDFVRHPSAGGIALFLGTTRAERHSVQGELLALDYEAYGEMALRVMSDLVARARGRWPTCLSKSAPRCRPPLAVCFSPPALWSFC